MSFPKSGSGSDIVTIKGAKEFVAGAKQNLLDRVKELDSQVTINCCIPQVHHRSVMGPKGVKVQAITKEFNVQIKFPDRQQNGEEPAEENVGDETDPRNIIVITGLKERCEAAKQALENLIPVSIEVPVDAKLHRYIIGQKGKDVRELMDKYDVNVKVPQAGENADYVTVYGAPENVAKCREELEERIKKLEEEEQDRKLKSFSLTIDVPAKHHPKIVGRKGAVVTKLREKHQVQIQFPSKNSDGEASSSSTITVTGYEQNAYAARDEILSMVQELDEMITRTIQLDHRYVFRIGPSPGACQQLKIGSFELTIVLFATELILGSLGSEAVVFARSWTITRWKSSFPVQTPRILILLKSLVSLLSRCIDLDPLRVFDQNIRERAPTPKFRLRRKLTPFSPILHRSGREC